MIYVAMYLGAIVAANLIIARLGPSASVLTAFLFIGLDLTARDHLHDAWHRDRLWRKMAALILAGSAISYALNRGAGRIAVASALSFGIAAVVDTVVYHLLGVRARMLRVNGSNVLSALADSLCFPTLAFGVVLPAVILGQFAAKVLGGFGWSLVLGLRVGAER